MLKLLGLGRKAARPLAADESAFNSTIISLTTAVPRPPAEPVRDRRVLDMLPIAKLSGNGGQTLCRIRSISAGGVAADSSMSLDVGAEVQLEFNSPKPMRGRVVWIRADMVGIKFDENVDLKALFSSRATRDGHVARPPRLEIQCGATIRIGGYMHKVQVRDISLGGMKVDLRDPDVVGQQASVTIDSLRTIKGNVRWYREGQAGILFDKPLSFEELTQWLANRTEMASLKAGAWQGGGLRRA